MSYGYNNPYQPQYRPYTQAPQVWQPSGGPNWAPPAVPQQTWQPPAEQPVVEPPVQEDPVAAAIRELTAAITALQKSMAAKPKKREAEDE